MRSTGEHINWLHLHGLVPQFIQHGNIPGQGGGVAGDVNYPVRLHVCEGLQHCFRAACPGRVYHYHIGAHTLLVEAGHDLGGIAYDEFCIPYVVVPGVFIGILDGGLHNLDTDDFPCLLGQEQGDGACAAVSVNDGFLSLEVGKFHGLVVEDFRLGSVHLEEGTGGDVEIQAAQAVLDGGTAPDKPGIPAHDDIVAVGLDILMDADHLGQP